MLGKLTLGNRGLLKRVDSGRRVRVVSAVGCRSMLYREAVMAELKELVID